MIIEHTPRTVTSHTEVKTFRHCRMKWYWRYVEGLSPVKTNMTMYRGTLGHLAQKAVRSGEDYRAAVYDHVKAESMAMLAEQVSEAYTLAESVLAQVGGYLDYWNANSRTTTVAAEKEIRVNRMGREFVMYIDSIEKDRETGKLFVQETKWVKQFRTMEMMDLDYQTCVYAWGGVEAGYPIAGVVYDQVNTPSAVPKQNKDGSLSKQPVGDQRTYRREIERIGLHESDYAEVLAKLPETREFRRERIIRTDVEVENAMRQVDTTIAEMNNTSVPVYMCDDHLKCGNCEFRELCIELLKGRDLTYLIESGFTKRVSAPTQENQHGE